MGPLLPRSYRRRSVSPSFYSSGPLTAILLRGSLSKSWASDGLRNSFGSSRPEISLLTETLGRETAPPAAFSKGQGRQLVLPS